MKSILATLALASATLVRAQTYSKCNPLDGSTTLYIQIPLEDTRIEQEANGEQTACPADPALGGNLDVDFTKGSSTHYASSNPAKLTYNGNGANFVITQAGDSPTITSDFYIMFGRVEVTMQAAPGVGYASYPIHR